MKAAGAVHGCGRGAAWLGLASALALGACDAPPEEGVVVKASPIVNGQDSAASQDSVVLLVRLVEGDAGQEVSQCTGTLVAPNLVLTARHCVSRVVDGHFRCDEAGRLLPGSIGGRVGAEAAAGTLYVFTGPVRPTFGTGQARPAATAVELFHDGAGVLCGHDLALARLDKKLVDVPIAPLRLDAPVTVGELVTVVGWGVTVEDSEPKRRQQRAGVAIRRVGPEAAPVADGAAVPPNEFATGEATCFGDSGGPVFSEATGAVVGLTSAGGNGRGASRNEPAAGCAGADTANYFSAVAPFAGVVASAFRAAGARPWVEGAPPPVASDGGCAVAPARPNASALLFLSTLALPRVLRRRLNGRRATKRPLGS